MSAGMPSIPCSRETEAAPGAKLTPADNVYSSPSATERHVPWNVLPPKVLPHPASNTLYLSRLAEFECVWKIHFC